MFYQYVFGGISSEIRSISRVFVNFVGYFVGIREFRGSATTRNFRSPVKGFSLRCRVYSLLIIINVSSGSCLQYIRFGSLGSQCFDFSVVQCSMHWGRAWYILKTEKKLHFHLDKPVSWWMKVQFFASFNMCWLIGFTSHELRYMNK